jgi:hypothetical protein
MHRVAVIAAAALLGIVVAGPVAAHDRTTSYSGWRIHGRAAEVAVRVAELDVSRFPWAAAEGADVAGALGAYLTRRLELLADGVPCATTEGPRALAGAPGRLVYEWRLGCPPVGALSVRSRLFLDVAPTHLHFARVTIDGGSPIERVLSEREPAWALEAGARPTATTTAAPLAGTSLAGYVGLGVEHILTGYDHLAFVLALLLIGGSLAEVARVVTGFTVAHSITLALAALGVVRPAAAPVEALVGLSIALVAAENVWLVGARGRALPVAITTALGLLALAAAAGIGRVPALTFAGLALFTLCYFGLLRRSARAPALRWAVACIFGLVHGFAFAGVLAEAQLDTARLVPALFGFNLGVELGQLGAVALTWPLLRQAARRPDGATHRTLVEAGSAAVLALGLFWFVTRAYG